MTEILITILILLVLAVLAGLVWLARMHLTGREEMVRQGATIGVLGQQLETIRQWQEKSNATLEKNLQTGQDQIGKYLHNSQQTLARLHEQMGVLQGTSSQMLQLGADVRSLQDILKNPKLRGQMGELSLEKVLREILPCDGFRMQHSFRSGRIVDALIRLPDYAVSVDAKFPLPSFEAVIACEDDAERTRLRRRFQADVAKHVDKIAASYILPDEGTLDFALMYIPAENVYYETIVQYNGDRMDLLGYALEKKVVPVSPNLLYAYLMTIVMGLHGLQIEKQAAEIRKNLGRIAMDFQAFSGTWDVLGKHLRNAQGQYDEGQNRLNRFRVQLDQIQGQSDPALPPDAGER